MVDGQPAGLPSTRAHIIVVQGPITQWNAILMKGNNLPPLVSLRAVLFGIDDAVRDFFQAAQYPDTCISRDYMCCVQFEQAGEIHRLVDAERWDVPIAKYVIGSLCLVEQTDDEDEGAGSDASTGIPTDDAEDDYQSWMSLSLDAGRDAWTRQRNSTWNSGTMMETEGTPMTALDLVEDGPKMNVGLSWSWLHHNRLQHARDGGEGNLDLTWSRGNDSDNDTVNDEVAWMSNWPVTFQFERPDLYPLKLVGSAEEEDKEEELQAEVLFANDLQEQAQAFIDQALEGLEEDDQQ